MREVIRGIRVLCKGPRKLLGAVLFLVGIGGVAGSVGLFPNGPGFECLGIALLLIFLGTHFMRECCGGGSPSAHEAASVPGPLAWKEIRKRNQEASRCLQAVAFLATGISTVTVGIAFWLPISCVAVAFLPLRSTQTTVPGNRFLVSSVATCLALGISCFVAAWLISRRPQAVCGRWAGVVVWLALFWLLSFVAPEANSTRHIAELMALLAIPVLLFFGGDLGDRSRRRRERARLKRESEAKDRAIA